MSDPVNHPSHYHSEYWHSACGKPIECIDIVRHMDFNTGNAVKYAWRAGKKGDAIEDLEKAVWYLNDRISELKRALEAQKEAEKQELDRAELLETLHAEIPVSTGIEVDFNTVSGGPGEYWVLYIYDIITANENWARFNRDDFFLQHPQRGAIRDAILGLITRLPTSAYDGLAPWVREAADDWTYAESVREGSC
jgi:hypothetical protein